MGLAARLTSLAAAAAAYLDGVSDYRAVDLPTQTLYNTSLCYSSEPTAESYFRVFINGVPSLFSFLPPLSTSWLQPPVCCAVVRLRAESHGEKKTAVKLRRQAESGSIM